MFSFFPALTKYPINFDAWSDGQMGSKLWLCEELEKIFSAESKDLVVWIYGSWYGLLAFLILNRQRIPIKKILLFDKDIKANKVAARILDYWTLRGELLEIHTEDCNQLQQKGFYSNERPDLVINTSCEHFSQKLWWEHLPSNTFYALQSTDMNHHEHINLSHSLNEFKDKLGLKNRPLFEGEKKFSYPSFEFHRWMLIGQK